METEERNVLACYIGIKATYYDKALIGHLEEFVLTGTHSYGLSDLKYFVPFTDKGIQGYYKIENVIPFIGKKDKNPELRLRLRHSNYVAWGRWKKTDINLPHPDIFSLTEISNIYESGILFLPRNKADKK